MLKVYYVWAKKAGRSYVSWHWRNFEEKLTFCLKNEMRNSEMHCLEMYCTFKNSKKWLKKLLMVSKMKYRIWKFGEQVVECKVDKSSVYDVLAEAIYFLEKLAHRISTFLCIGLSSVYLKLPKVPFDFWNQESAFV